jgi:hypothetical protein
MAVYLLTIAVFLTVLANVSADIVDFDTSQASHSHSNFTSSK